MSDITPEGEHITTVKKEMGITHADFFNVLPALLNDTPYQQHENIISFCWYGKKTEIMLGPEGVRRLGESICLPVTSVSLHFFAFTEDEIQEFIRCFNLKFMKGGG